MEVRALKLDKKVFMEDDSASMRFWYTHRTIYSTLFNIPKRAFSITISSCSSERLFSAVNEIVTWDCFFEQQSARRYSYY